MHKNSTYNIIRPLLFLLFLAGDLFAYQVVTAQEQKKLIINKTEQLNSVPTEDSTLVSDSVKVLTGKELQKHIRDSIKTYKDSLLRATPRVLRTYLFNDKTVYQRMFLWKTDTYFNNPKLIKPDTLFNDNFEDLPQYRNDVNAVSLGVSGSAMQYFNYFKREEFELFPFLTPYLPYTYTTDNFRFYNVKTPYTEFYYDGTLFANKKKEETNIKFLHTQNFTPNFNFNILYQRYGANGMLTNEKTDDRTFALTANYIGKRYVAQGGYIFSRVKRTENGGVSDLSMVTDTIVDIRTVPVILSDANTLLKRNTFFISHSYGVPLNLFKKSDTTSIADGTVTYFGHYGEYSTYTKSYTDNISTSNTEARDFYNNNFYINPTVSADSARVMRLENRLYIKVQPWSKEAIVSNLDAGIGFQILSLYGFNRDYFIAGNKNIKQNNSYLYFGASGQFRKYFSWNGLGKYNITGYYKNNFSIDGNMKFSVYPGNLKQGMHLNASVSISTRRPDYFYNHYYSNHYKWDNNFSNTTNTKVEVKFEIPDWKLEMFAGYALLNNNIYLDSLVNVCQNTQSMSIFTAYLKKDFTVWKLHFDNKILFQHSSDDDVVPLPKVSLNLRYYLEFDLVKNVLKSQLGANATFYTKYYSPGYSPALGLFYNQNKMEIGGKPYLDIFVNFQWKRACIFVKFINAAQNTLTNKEYFSAYRYIKPQTSLKFGVYWPFYLH